MAAAELARSLIQMSRPAGAATRPAPAFQGRGLEAWNLHHNLLSGEPLETDELAVRNEIRDCTTSKGSSA
jgi:hypothetical protein